MGDLIKIDSGMRIGLGLGLGLGLVRVFRSTVCTVDNRHDHRDRTAVNFTASKGR